VIASELIISKRKRVLADKGHCAQSGKVPSMLDRKGLCGAIQHIDLQE